MNSTTITTITIIPVATPTPVAMNPVVREVGGSSGGSRDGVMDVTAPVECGDKHKPTTSLIVAPEIIHFYL